jgi:hypothetical protein
MSSVSVKSFQMSLELTDFNITEQEDWNAIKETEGEIQQPSNRSFPWWYRKLNSVFHLYDEEKDLGFSGDCHVSFSDPYIVASYAYQGSSAQHPAARRDNPHDKTL